MATANNMDIKLVTDTSFDSEVLNSSMPVLLDYWTDWCQPCKAIEPTLSEAAASYAGRLTVAKLNTDENPSIPQRYRVRGVPTVMLFKDGQVIATKVGAFSKSQLDGFLEGLV